MQSNSRVRLLCGIAAVAAFPAAAFAQAQSAAPPAAVATPQPAPDATGEIVVTAQRRRENLQNVPITVTAVTAQALAASGVTNTTDLVNVVPGLTMPNSAGYSLPHLRGVGVTAIGPGIENSVALYVDGVYRGVSSSDALDLNNISQVEVEKGPQGTLFGRNATGGLIQVTTLDPKPGALSGKAQVGYANYNTPSGSVYVTGGSDLLSADLAVQDSAMGQGWGKNLYNGQDVYRVYEDLSLRSKWLYRPTAGTKVTVILDYAENKNSMAALRNYQNVPNAFYPKGFASLPTFDVDDNAQPVRHTRDEGASIQVDQDVGFADLIDTAAYRQDVYSYDIDFDLGPGPYSLNDARQADEQLTEELQLVSKRTTPVNWIVGTYYYNATNGYDPQNIYFSGPGIANPAKPVTQINNQLEEKTSSIAAYGQVTYDVTSDTRLTGGLRYTYEERNLVGVQTGYLNGVIPLTLANVNTGIITSTPTWRVALDHDFTDEIHGYVSYNRGFKSGGYNVGAPTLAPYQPEHLDDYEIGLKTQFLDRRLTFNTAFFYYNYNNIQVSRFVNGSPQIYNGGGAVLYGLDGDVTMRVTERLTLSAGLELEQDHFTSFPNADFFLSCATAYPTICSLSAKGKQLPQTPNVSGTLNVDYRMPLSDGQQVRFNLNEAANGGYYYAPNNEYRQPGYALTNGSIAWTRDRYTVTLWGKNLTNVVYPVSVNQAPTAVAAAYAAPRTYGVTLGATF